MMTQTAYRTHLVLADRRPRVRFALRTLLERQPGIEIVGEAADAETLLAELERGCPDVLLLDWRQKRPATVDLAAALLCWFPTLYMIALFFILLSVYLTRRGEWKGGLLALGVAIAIRYYAILLLPFYVLSLLPGWKRRLWGTIVGLAPWLTINRRSSRCAVA